MTQARTSLVRILAPSRLRCTVLVLMMLLSVLSHGALGWPSVSSAASPSLMMIASDGSGSHLSSPPALGSQPAAACPGPSARRAGYRRNTASEPRNRRGPAWPPVPVLVGVIASPRLGLGARPARAETRSLVLVRARDRQPEAQSPRRGELPGEACSDGGCFPWFRVRRPGARARLSARPAKAAAKLQVSAAAALRLSQSSV